MLCKSFNNYFWEASFKVEMNWNWLLPLVCSFYTAKFSILACSDCDVLWIRLFNTNCFYFLCWE